MKDPNRTHSGGVQLFLDIPVRHPHQPLSPRPPAPSPPLVSASLAFAFPLPLLFTLSLCLQDLQDQ